MKSSYYKGFELDLLIEESMMAIPYFMRPFLVLIISSKSYLLESSSKEKNDNCKKRPHYHICFYPSKCKTVYLILYPMEDCPILGIQNIPKF